MDYELFQASAVKAFGHCRDVKAMVSDMQQVLSAVPGMVRKNERLEKEKAEMRQENAALKAGLDDWKGNAEGFEPDAYMRLPLDADGAAIRPGDKIYFDGDPESEALICVAIGCWPLPVEFMDWGKTGTTAWENGNVFTHHRPKPEPPDSWDRLLGDLDRARNEGHGDGECLYADCASGNCGDCRFDSRQLEPQDCCIDHIFGDIADRIRTLRGKEQ